MFGIDISMHNGKVDFGKVKSSWVQAVYIKATEGVEYTDPLYKQHLEGVKSVGLNFGMYHFMSEKTSPTQQAIDFYNAINGTGYNLIPCLDVETNKLNRFSSEISDRVIEFLTKFKELSGIDCIIYTGGYFGRDNLDSRVKQYRGWIAHYGVSKPMENGFNVIGHQYTETGRVDGISTNVDLNNFSEEILLSRSAPVQEQPKENSMPSYEQHGNATVLVDKLNIRTEPSVNAEIVASYTKGETIYNYDMVFENDGYRWIRYVGASGNYRYAAVRVLETNKKYANCY